MDHVASAGARSVAPAGGGPARSRWPVLWPVVPAALLAHRLPELPASAWVLALAVLGCAALVPRRPPWRWLGVAALSMAFCFWRAGMALEARIDPAIEGVDLAVTGHVESMPVAGSFGPVLRFRIADCRLSEPRSAADPLGRLCPAGGRVVLRWFGGADAPMPEPGSRWSLTIRLKRNHAVLNPGGYDAELAALAEGVAGRGYVRAGSTASGPPVRLADDQAGIGIAFEWARTWVRGRLGEVLAKRDPEAVGTLVALVVGDQSAIPPKLWQVYQRTGVGHLMSISGLHITMLAAMALWACRRLLGACARRAPALFERWPAPMLAWWPALAMAFAYSVFSGWGIPAQRTCWMLAVAAWASATGRAGRITEVLALAAAVVVVSDPWAPLSAGFWLSFAAVGAIVLHGGAAGQRPGWWRQAVGTQWAATIAMFPLGAVFFASVSLVGPLANAFAIPVVSAVVTPLALAGAGIATVAPTIGELLLWPVAVLTSLLIAGLRLLSNGAGAIAVVASPGLPVLFASIAAGYCLLAPGRPIARRQACVLMLPLLVGTDPRPPAGHWRLTAIDVGQGNAVLVETHRHRLLYDTGPSYGPGSDAGMRHVVPWLRRRGIADIDRLIVSHEDADHAGGARSVLDSIRVGDILGSLGRAHRLAPDPRFAPCARGQRWVWDGVEFEMLHPGPDRIEARSAGGPRRVYGGNGSSCVLRIRSEAGSALLAGDIEAAGERDLVRVYGDAGLRADVLLVPHHGSATSSSAAFIMAVAPYFGVVQIGYRNRFRHPNAGVMERYRRRGIELLRSDALATIRIDFAPGWMPAVASWRLSDRRYWRIDVETDADPAAPAAVPASALAPTPGRFLLGRPAAVDREGRAPHLVRPGAAQVDRHGADLLGGHELDRGLLLGQQVDPRLLATDAFALGAGVDLPLHQGGEHPAGADRIAGHAGAGGLEGDHLGEADDGMLGGDIGRLLGRGHLAVGRGDVDDAAPVGALHAGQREAGGMEYRRQIERDDRVPALAGEVLDVVGVLDAGVVHEDVHLASRIRDAGEHPFDRVGVHQIGAVVADVDIELGRDPGPLALDVLVLAEAVEDDVRTLGRQRARGGQSDAAGRSGHQRELVLEHSNPPANMH